MSEIEFDIINLKNTMLSLIEILNWEIHLLRSGSKLSAEEMQLKDELSQSVLIQNNLLYSNENIIASFDAVQKSELRNLAQELQNTASLNSKVLQGALVFSGEVISLVNEYITRHHEKARVYDCSGKNQGVYLKKMPFSISVNDNI